jgi:hypothetical protein
MTGKHGYILLNKLDINSIHLERKISGNFDVVWAQLEQYNEQNQMGQFSSTMRKEALPCLQFTKFLECFCVYFS